jgi:hypothetical protein
MENYIQYNRYKNIHLYYYPLGISFMENYHPNTSYDKQITILEKEENSKKTE